MAIFDEETQRIVVRVVYDGPAGAGKTTNVRQLCGFFTAGRRSELYVPEEVDGRTLFFDWLQLEGGLVCGHRLRCQMLTIAGQRELVHRRSRVIQTADVVVFVCESNPAALVRARSGLETLRSFLRARMDAAPPIIVQANKQDLPDALKPEEIAEFLGLDSSTQVVPARASEGVGVRETAVLSIRAAAIEVQRAILHQGIASITRRGETAQDLYASMRASEPAALLPVDWHPTVEERVSVAPPPAEEPVVTVEPSEPMQQSEAAPPRVRTREIEALPPFPAGDVPSGFIWPAATGRDVLRRLQLSGATRRDDLVARGGGDDGSATNDLVLIEAAGWCLKTSPRRRFRDADLAREALLRAAREKISLGAFRLRETVLVAQPGTDGTFWLWNVTPWVTTLRAEMARKNDAGDELGLGTVLERYARAAIDAMFLALRTGVALDLHPSNLATVEQSVGYLDDDVFAGTRLPAIGYSLLHRAEEYGHRERAMGTYALALELGLQTLSSAELDHLDLAGALREAVVRSSAAETLRHRLLGALARQRG